jgi:hypothetical protein
LQKRCCVAWRRDLIAGPRAFDGRHARLSWTFGTEQMRTLVGATVTHQQETLMSQVTLQARTGQAPGKLDREAFHRKFVQSFHDPRFDPLRGEIAQLEEIAWRNYCDSRKAPITIKAGAGFADPDYDLSI